MISKTFQNGKINTFYAVQLSLFLWGGKQLVGKHPRSSLPLPYAQCLGMPRIISIKLKRPMILGINKKCVKKLHSLISKGCVGYHVNMVARSALNLFHLFETSIRRGRLMIINTQHKTRCWTNIHTTKHLVTGEVQLCLFLLAFPAPVVWWLVLRLL